MMSAAIQAIDSGSGGLLGLARRAAILLFDRDEAIVAQDEAAAYCYLVVSGCVRTVRLMRDGRRQVGEFLFAGDLLGWDCLGTHDFAAEAVCPVTARRFARHDLDRLADRDRTLRDRLFNRLRSGRDHMVLLGRQTAPERIASFLLEMAARIGPDGETVIELPMSRGDMADYLGLTIETVCRQLTRLRLSDAIAIDGTKIAIRDRLALEEAG
jgi:CRP/FNR family transcriptional regulator, nitrogen fixation regulation protein